MKIIPKFVINKNHINMKMLRLKNTNTGNEFDETEAGYKIRMKSEKMMEGIELIGEINPATGKVDENSAAAFIEETKIINFKKDEGKTTGTKSATEEKDSDTEPEADSEKGGDAGTKETKTTGTATEDGAFAKDREKFLAERKGFGGKGKAKA